jgi:hypothetical protein
MQCPATNCGKLIDTKWCDRLASDEPKTRRRRKREDKVDRPREIGEDLNGYFLKCTTSGKFLQVYDRNPSHGIPATAKLLAIMGKVKKWQAEAPDDKIISECL